MEFAPTVSGRLGRWRGENVHDRLGAKEPAVCVLRPTAPPAAVENARRAALRPVVDAWIDELPEHLAGLPRLLPQAGPRREQAECPPVLDEWLFEARHGLQRPAGVVYLGPPNSEVAAAAREALRRGWEFWAVGLEGGMGVLGVPDEEDWLRLALQRSHVAIVGGTTRTAFGDVLACCAAGLPVVVLETAPVRELLEDCCAVCPAQAEALLEACEAMLEGWHERSRAAVQWASDVAWPKHAARAWLAALDELA